MLSKRVSLNACVESLDMWALKHLIAHVKS